MQNTLDVGAKWKQWLAHREQEWRKERSLEERRLEYDEEIEEQITAEYQEQMRQCGEEWAGSTESIDWCEERREQLRDQKALEEPSPTEDLDEEWRAFLSEHEEELRQRFAAYQASEKVYIRRHWNDHKIGAVPLESLSGLHWGTISGGVQKRAPRAFIYGHISCTNVEGEIGHSGIHGPCPHEIKVCLVKKDNEATTWNRVLSQLKS